jgi:hypothetical protein
MPTVTPAAAAPAITPKLLDDVERVRLLLDLSAALAAIVDLPEGLSFANIRAPIAFPCPPKTGAAAMLDQFRCLTVWINTSNR